MVNQKIWVMIRVMGIMALIWLQKAMLLKVIDSHGGLIAMENLGQHQATREEISIPPYLERSIIKLAIQ